MSSTVSLDSLASLSDDSSVSVGVIGGGFYGCVTALTLADQGMQVVLFEQKSELFRSCSGIYGVRLHAGPHYPRSLATRRSCQRVLHQFIERFPTVVVDLYAALHGLGIEDAEGLPARVTPEQFDEVCQECPGYERLSAEDHGITGVHGLWNVTEPCLNHSRVRELFTKLIDEHKNIDCVFNHRVETLQETKDGKNVILDGITFDWVVNCTYFKSFISKKVLGAQVKYQPCLTLTYEDLSSKRDDAPFSLTIMDGWFPCLMPIVMDEDKDRKHNKYMLYHAKYTILGSYDSVQECEKHMASVEPSWVLNVVRDKMEKHMETFMPGFTKRFRYTGYMLESATKLRTATEFRRSVVWREGRLIHEFSGKVTESVSAADEVLKIITSGGDANVLDNQSLGELSTVSSDIDGACDMGVHRWETASVESAIGDNSSC